MNGWVVVYGTVRECMCISVRFKETKPRKTGRNGANKENMVLVVVVVVVVLLVLVVPYLYPSLYR